MVIDDSAPGSGGDVSRAPSLAALQSAVESARNGIVLTDPLQKDNPIVYANPSFLELTGYSLTEGRFADQSCHVRIS